MLVILFTQAMQMEDSQSSRQQSSLANVSSDLVADFEKKVQERTAFVSSNKTAGNLRAQPKGCVGKVASRGVGIAPDGSPKDKAESLADGKKL